MFAQVEAAALRCSLSDPLEILPEGFIPV